MLHLHAGGLPDSASAVVSRARSRLPTSTSETNAVGARCSASLAGSAVTSTSGSSTAPAGGSSLAARRGGEEQKAGPDRGAHPSPALAHQRARGPDRRQIGGGDAAVGVDVGRRLRTPRCRRAAAPRVVAVAVEQLGAPASRDRTVADDAVAVEVADGGVPWRSRWRPAGGDGRAGRRRGGRADGVGVGLGGAAGIAGVQRGDGVEVEAALVAGRNAVAGIGDGGAGIGDAHVGDPGQADVGEVERIAAGDGRDRVGRCRCRGC